MPTLFKNWFLIHYITAMLFVFVLQKDERQRVRTTARMGFQNPSRRHINADTTVVPHGTQNETIKTQKAKPHFLEGSNETHRELAAPPFPRATPILRVSNAHCHSGTAPTENGSRVLSRVFKAVSALLLLCQF